MEYPVREKQGMTPVELSRRLLVTAGNITGLIDRMEKSGVGNACARYKGSPHNSDSALRVKVANSQNVQYPDIPRILNRNSQCLDETEKNQLHKNLDKLIRTLEE